ncbi:MBL fold metallo-hydrolase [Maribacter hydrothermalis]|uniref:Sulfurtransferase n=1 Tax=Maribacter hydrothermalis TaxID=1836467 RepID=A0A1B7Z899_9FLAO|nr:MBL fold metallo-hydrolase [Maribacter hydrothermalis]APQ19050.1 MBL fold metallo-hydrolase [Maribacter hydrothermalis]OBR38937.1 sulfurtransferase [Maribacter hydrothermalis]
MIIKQFEYKPLAHYSYAVISDGKMAVIDPERDPNPYYNFAKSHNAKITKVLETHPHADFVSSHVQIHEETGATIYHSSKLKANYPFTPFDDGDTLNLGYAEFKAIHTPGHSPDSITIVAVDDQETLLFTGDTLFVGDVGRPDLSDNLEKDERQELAEAMYHTIQEKFKGLPDNAIIYPTHGAGSLCGKSMGDAHKSTLGEERKNNWAFKKQSKEKFVSALLEDLPFIPSYFPFNVTINKKGADNLEKAIASIPFSQKSTASGMLVDMRDEKTFKKGHLKGSINIQADSDDAKFETWLGAIVRPKEEFTLIIDGKEHMDKLVNRVAKIGYEKQLKKAITISEDNLATIEQLDLKDFKKNPKNYTIVDVRNKSEVEEGKFFEHAISHPLHELRDTIDDIPTDKPIVVHCAGGYRSAAGSSIIAKHLDTTVFDLSDDVKDFK